MARTTDATPAAGPGPSPSGDLERDWATLRDSLSTWAGRLRRERGCPSRRHPFDGATSLVTQVSSRTRRGSVGPEQNRRHCSFQTSLVGGEC